MHFHIYVLIFAQSIREGNVELYIESLRKVIKWISSRKIIMLVGNHLFI